MKTVQLSDNEIRALDGDELMRLLERCYTPKPMPRRKDERDDLFGDMELLHGHLSTLAQLRARMDVIPSAGVKDSPPT